MAKKMRAGGLCFMVKDRRGLLHSFSAAQTRQGAREKLRDICKSHTWRQLYRQGYRVVRVQYTEID